MDTSADSGRPVRPRRVERDKGLNSRRGLCRFGGYVGNVDTLIFGTDSNIQCDVKC